MALRRAVRFGAGFTVSGANRDVLVGRNKAVAIAARNASGRSKLNEWLERHV